MAGGRPRAFSSVEELQASVDEYFATEADNGDPVTVSGLAYALNIDRRTLLRYQDEDNEFCPTIKRAIAFIESDKIKNAMKGTYDKTICIFDLKNNHGWKDEKHIDQKTNARVNVAIDEESAVNVAGAVAKLIQESL